MNRCIGVLFFLVLSTVARAQIVPKVYNQFFMNPYVYNPAYAGVEGHAVAFFTYKKGWLGINDAPTLMNANFHVPLKGGIALGALVYNQSSGLFSQSGGKITGGYLVSIDREHFLRFGLSLGAGNNTLSFGELDDTSPAFANIGDNTSFLLGDFGFTYHFGHFNLGASLPNLFSYDLYTSESISPIRVNPQDNIFFKMNYRGHLGNNIAVEPHLIYRYNKQLKDQYEATMIVHLLHIIWVGATYRQDAGFVGLLGAKLYEKIGIGYAYEYGNPETASYSGPTHEIHIGYHIGTRKKHTEHASSFIKSHQLSAAERAKEAELERQKKLQALRESREQAAAETAADNELGILGAKEEEAPDTHWSYEKESKPIERVNQFGEVERGIKFDRTNEEGEKEVVFSWLPPPPPGSKEETYEIADPTQEPLIRTTTDGKREAGIKWVRTVDGGQPETLIIWDKIVSEEQASKLDHNKAEAMSLDSAKIVIRNKEPEPVQEEPETITQEEPEIIEEKAPEVTPDPVVITEVKEEPTPEEKDVVEVVEQILEEEKEKGDPELTNDFRSHDQLANSDEHLEVRRGGHMLELEAGNYVVAGVFESFENAEKLSDKLFLQGYHDARNGYLSARGYYYVTIYQSDSLSATQKERQRIRKNSSLSKVWVLKVTE